MNIKLKKNQQQYPCPPPQFFLPMTGGPLGIPNTDCEMILHGKAYKLTFKKEKFISLAQNQIW